MSRPLLVLELSCPGCGAVLTEGTRVRLYGHVRRTGQQRELSLSAVFGDAGGETDAGLEAGDIVDLSCPRCEASLMLPLDCKLCGASMASLNVARGGSLEFCSRVGCRAHPFGGTGNIDDMMRLMNRMFRTPYD